MNLTALDALPVKTDTSVGLNKGRKYVYDLPTLDDPNTPNNGVRRQGYRLAQRRTAPASPSQRRRAVRVAEPDTTAPGHRQRLLVAPGDRLTLLLEPPAP